MKKIAILIAAFVLFTAPAMASVQPSYTHTHDKHLVHVSSKKHHAKKQGKKHHAKKHAKKSGASKPVENGHTTAGESLPNVTDSTVGPQ